MCHGSRGDCWLAYIRYLPVELHPQPHYSMTATAAHSGNQQLRNSSGRRSIACTFQNLSFLLLFSADHLAASPMASSIANTIRNLGLPNMRLRRPGQTLQRLPNIGTDTSLSQRFMSETNRAPLAKAACNVVVSDCKLSTQQKAGHSFMTGNEQCGCTGHTGPESYSVWLFNVGQVQYD